MLRQKCTFANTTSFLNSPSVTCLTFKQHISLGPSFGKVSRKQGCKICSSSYKRDNCTCQDSSFWEGHDLWIPLIVRKGVKGTDWSLFLSMHELGSLATVLGTRFKRRHFITAWLCTLSLVECFGTWHRKADANAHGTLQVFQRYKDTNHSRFRKYAALETGRHQESIRASHTLPLFVPFSGHKWTWNTV